MLSRLLISTLASLALVVHSCPEHDFHAKRAESIAPVAKWGYEASYNWGRLSEDYRLCQSGTQQAPIPLLLTQGLSLNHVPTFDYDRRANGTFYNWGHGPAMTLAHEQGEYTTLPSFTFEESPGEDETVHLIGWHVHSPGEHTVQGDRSKSEMHFVHVDATGKPRAVLAFRIDPGNSESTFFAGLPEFFGFREGDVGRNSTVTFNPSDVLDEVDRFSEFWTYQGSLTTPPCTEGIRFFVARTVLFVSHQQMQDLLGASTYSSRAQQQVWLHQINV